MSLIPPTKIARHFSDGKLRGKRCEVRSTSSDMSEVNHSNTETGNKRRLSDYDLIGNVLNTPLFNNTNNGGRQSVTRVPLMPEPEELRATGLNSKRGSLESELSLDSWVGKRR